MPDLEEQEERRRLTSHYAGMTDGELQALARHCDSLTEAAAEVLEDEFDRRHLKWPDQEAPTSRQEMELRKLVTIRQFRDLPEALLAKGSLESAGIECFLADENIVRLDWFISNFIGGIKLAVKAQDAEAAQSILNDEILEGLYVPGVGLYEQPRCPKCGSLDVNIQESERPIQQRPWHCQLCDAEWIDDKESGDASS